ncbi:Phosphoribosylformylglycinamidine synthase subunit PurS [Candidatus Gugararchaeum adminiculabundum]|nr:Phosphoribosylformylglycinamidine synthase subunit PurS [Candidatus Gugararchaeum adminiculabundum]
MTEYTVEVVIESKPAAKDPEGETIARELLMKNGFGQVHNVRTAKMLKVKLEAENEEQAKNLAERMVRELRLANPVAHIYSINVKG